MFVFITAVEVLRLFMFYLTILYIQKTALYLIKKPKVINKYFI